MAKTKKNKKSASKKVEPKKEPSAIWAFAYATVLVLIAIFMVIGGFAAGGVLPVGLYRLAYWLFGWGSWLVPVALIFFAVIKVKSELKKVPIGKLISMILTIVSFSAIWFTITAQKTYGVWTSSKGGHIGKFIGVAFLQLLDKVPASLLFFAVFLVSIFFDFSISPSVLGKLFSGLKPKEKAGELAELKAKTENKFKLNEGVPVEHYDTPETTPDKPAPRLSSLKNTAQKLSEGERHEALTTTSDPDWQFPAINLLNQKQDKADAGDVNGNARSIHDTFANFKIEVEMEGANIGPRVTQYTLKPPADVKLTKITALENNLALDLAAHSIRMEAPIPGKRAVGIEVPNVKPATVRVSSLITSKEWADLASPLTFAIGKDISGKPVVADLASMPHLLIAGQTGAGKSVMINTILISMLYRNSPSDLKLILVDPKQVEMGPYNDLPHLLTPVINDPEKCISALKWAVAEMDRRLKTMADDGKRNIAEYNDAKKAEGMPYIVIIIDELADLMMMAARDVEALIVRLAQKARAAGIHLILATQRPSVDVITGLIKANVPARIAFTVASQVDSRTIIDQIGAEKLLGKGDMLLLTSDMPKPKRVQAAFIEHSEIVKVNDFIRMQRPPQYDDEVISQPVQLGGRGAIVGGGDVGGGDGDDNLWKEAVKVVIDNRKASTSLLQRRLRIGYGRAARLIETMEEQGIIGSADGSKARDVLVSSMDEVFGGAGDAEELEAEVYD